MITERLKPITKLSKENQEWFNENQENPADFFCGVMDSEKVDGGEMDGSFEQFSRCYEFVESRKSDECGCPEEDWIIGMLYTTIHIESDGSGHIFIDCGDWQDEKLVPTKTIEELRIAAADWVLSFPIED